MYDELKLIKIDENISYICPTKNPLSANVVIIQCENGIWLYDVGSHPGIPEMLNSLNPDKKRVNVVLSHFHKDHIYNLENIKYDKLYQGKMTYRYTNDGTVVESDIFIEDGDVRLHIFPIPSSHAKGSVALEINETYCFLGDSVYAMEKESQRVYNAGLLQEQIKILKKITSNKFMLSHKEPFATSKDAVIKWLEDIYSRREKNEAYIKAEG